MTDQLSPITPPPELLHQWATEYWGNPITIGEGEKYIAIQAARWGSDQELEACCEWLPSDLTINGESLRDVRRPKPPSLKEQALADLDRIPTHDCDGDQIADLSNIRRALEQLDD